MEVLTRRELQGLEADSPGGREVRFEHPDPTPLAISALPKKRQKLSEIVAQYIELPEDPPGFDMFDDDEDAWLSEYELADLAAELEASLEPEPAPSSPRQTEEPEATTPEKEAAEAAPLEAAPRADSDNPA